MIHTLVVRPGMSAEELRKEFRKRLMTGGAVVRLPQRLTSEEQQLLVEEFLPIAIPHSAAAEVMRQLAAHSDLVPEYVGRLQPWAAKKEVFSDTGAALSQQFFESVRRDDMRRRLMLARHPQLPESIRQLLERDKAREVRFAARESRKRTM